MHTSLNRYSSLIHPSLHAHYPFGSFFYISNIWNRAIFWTLFAPQTHSYVKGMYQSCNNLTNPLYRCHLALNTKIFIYISILMHDHKLWHVASYQPRWNMSMIGVNRKLSNKNPVKRNQEIRRKKILVTMSCPAVKMSRNCHVRDRCRIRYSITKTQWERNRGIKKTKSEFDFSILWCQLSIGYNSRRMTFQFLDISTNRTGYCY